MHLTFATIQTAWKGKDPALVDYIIQLAQQDQQITDQPIRDEALTFQRFLRHISRADFREQSAETQKQYRQQQLALLEVDDAEVPLAEPLKLYRILLLLWQDDSEYARQVLLQVIQDIPLVYGPWKALKHIYKAAEQQHDYPILGEIAARFDRSGKQHDISQPTMTYMTRRAWRFLRQLGESLPACYAEAAVHYLAAYPEDTNWQDTWIANHILHHHGGCYSRSSFGYINSPRQSRLKNRAFQDSWQRSPEPLFRLLELARAETMREFAFDALKNDFAIELRNVEASSLLRLMALPLQSAALDNCIVWLLQQSSRFEQQQYRALGLHQGVIQLLDSGSATACQYACNYVKAHARDLSMPTLLRLANSTNKEVRKLAQQLLSERKPREEVGLAAWGELLASEYAHSFASSMLRKHFGRKELDQTWFQQRLHAKNAHSLRFVEEHLLELHPLKTLPPSFFSEVLLQLEEDYGVSDDVAEFCLRQLHDIGPAQLDSLTVQTLLLHPLSQTTAIDWLDDGNIAVNSLPIDYCKALAYEPDWQQHSFINELRNQDLPWVNSLQHYDGDLGKQMRDWLADVRLINPAELGFEWLMQLVNREEAQYHDFASERMSKAFVPADFAPQDSPAEQTVSSDTPAVIDLDGQTFLFTGKLQTMTRKEAQNKVTDANGRNAGTINGKLNYLVIGDEGSPLYGNGRKGSKQLKAEGLIEKGAELRIISETAFLQMLAGEQREFSADSVIAGCETLWEMLEQADTPIGKFARQYLRQHHPDICLAETDRPVDPGAEIPPEFLSFERFAPLFQHSNDALRRFALSFAEWEFARWQPESAELIKLCESRYKEVREFTAEALLAEDEPDSRRYRLDAGKLEANAVYSFCESRDAHTRQLGMQIIQQHEHFQQPQALFQLSESPDRELRAFVVRVLWSLYRHYSTTRHWQPRLRAMGDIGKKQQADKAAAQQQLGQGLPPRPAQLPADHQALQALLQRWLYELPPGRLGKGRLNTGLKPLAASKAKKVLIETFRDLAIEDVEFAQLVLPLLRQFTRSRGAMEQAACLVAVTRIQHTHPQLGDAA